MPTKTMIKISLLSPHARHNDNEACEHGGRALCKIEDNICHENSQQIAITDYLFSVNFHGR